MPDDLIRRLAEDVCRECCGVRYIGPLDKVESRLRKILAPLLIDREAMKQLRAIGKRRAVRLENLIAADWRVSIWGFTDEHGRLSKQEWWGDTPTEAINKAAADAEKGPSDEQK